MDKRHELEVELSNFYPFNQDVLVDYERLVDHTWPGCGKAALLRGDKFLCKADSVGALNEYAILETTITSNEFDLNKVHNRIAGLFKTRDERDDHLAKIVAISSRKSSDPRLDDEEVVESIQRAVDSYDMLVCALDEARHHVENARDYETLEIIDAALALARKGGE